MTGPRGLGFNDHFSGHARAYARARPDYPDALFEWLARNAPARRLAWDCATGNGQAARSLAPHFETVVASDASEKQIAAAEPADGIDFRVAPAEASGLADGSVDLLTVAQALHWFDLPAFFAEADRVLVPGGLLAAWCYGFCRVSPGVDEIVDALYRDLADYWPPERAHIESGYRDIRLPFEQVEAPPFRMAAEWRADDLLAYLATWSAVQRCRRSTGRDAVAEIAAPLRSAVGKGTVTITWPLTVLAGRNAAWH